MSRAVGPSILLVVLLWTGSGCGTMANLAGQEPWLMGPAPVRTVDPFGGVDNDVRWMKRAIRTEGVEALPIVVAAIDIPLSLAGDVVTLPWTTCQTLVRRNSPIKLSFDKSAMEKELSKRLAVGMPIDRAKTLMEDAGFTCREWKSDPPAIHCTAVAERGLITLNQVGVRLQHDSGKLTDVKVECATVGP